MQKQRSSEEKVSLTHSPCVLLRRDLRLGDGCAGKPRAGGITLKLLIDEGILEPGENVLTVEYKSSMTSASLAADGRIHCAVGLSPSLSLLWLSDIDFCWHFSSSCCSCAGREVHTAGASGF